MYIYTDKTTVYKSDIVSFVESFSETANEKIIKECIRTLMRWYDSLEASMASYLVARGVKIVYMLGSCFVSIKSEQERELVEKIMVGGVEMMLGPKSTEITSCEPIVFSTSGCGLMIGIAAQPWVVETYQWLMDNKSNLPERVFESLEGQLLGYDSISIQKFVDTRCV